MNHYPHHIGDFAKKTKGLTLTERGAYRELLDQYYVYEKPLPLDQREIYGMAGAVTPTERKAVDRVIGKYFEKLDDGYHQKRADEEIVAYQKRAEQARTNGEKGGRRKTEPPPHPDTGSGAGSPPKPPPKPGTGSVPSGVPDANQSGKLASSHKPEPVAKSVTVASPSAPQPPPPLPPGGDGVANGTRPPPQPKRKSDSHPSATAEVSRAFGAAYFERYNAEFSNNAKSMGHFRDLVDRIGRDAAPHVAAHFVRSNNQYYQQRGHNPECLVKDAEKLKTEWTTGRHGTATEARQADQTQARANVWDGVRDDLIPNETKPTH